MLLWLNKLGIRLSTSSGIRRLNIVLSTSSNCFWPAQLQPMQRLLTVFSTFDNVPEHCMSQQSSLEQNAKTTVELLAHQKKSYTLQLMLPNANYCKTAAALRHKLQALLVLGNHLLTICHWTSPIGGPRTTIPTCHFKTSHRKKHIHAVLCSTCWYYELNVEVWQHHSSSGIEV